jgi:spore coat polysaccharide biosynthesis protein SpsF
MKVVAIIQARMGSTRLPGKVLRDIAGETMLARVVRRVQLARMPDAVVVATTLAPSDDAIVAECVRLGVPAFRGSEQDVLDRYWQATCTHQADVIVRITADCPLIDPRLVDYVVAAFLEGQPDYASNVLERTYPRGLDAEVMTLATLERAWREAEQTYQRAHVTPYIYQNPDRFRLLSVRADADYSAYRWTVDTPEDLAFVQAVYARLRDKPAAPWTVVLTLLTGEPDLAEMNRDIQQKALHEG